MGSRAFGGLESLDYVICRRENNTIEFTSYSGPGYYPFYGTQTSNKKLFVPAGSETIYGGYLCGAPFVVCSLDELPTRIEKINESTSVKRAVDDAWYTINGQRLQGEPTTKGIYIRGGRKVLVK